MIAQHSSKSVEHYTPPKYIEAARELMGHIDLDPATCVEANSIVLATDTMGPDWGTDGLKQEWHGSVWLNPPGGLINRKSSAAVWLDKLCREYVLGRVKQAVFLGFTLEILRTGQDCLFPPQAFPRCYPRDRIRFIQPGMTEGEHPSHANVLIYLPSREHLDTAAGISKRDWEAKIDRFFLIFGRFGVCEVPGRFRKHILT